MSRIDELIQELCPDGVRHVALSEVADYSSTRVDAADLDETTFVGVDNLVAEKGGRVDASYPPNTARLTAYEPGDILLGNIRPYLKKVWQATNEGGCSGDVLAIRIKGENRAKIDSNFLYYLLSSDVFFAYNMQHAKGAKMPRGNKAAILEYRIPVPPPEIQCEIVRVLDKFTQLEVELEAELEARRAQYDYFFRDLLSFGSDEAKELTLGDIGRVAMCKRVFKSETSDNGDVPFFKIGTFGGPPDAYISRELFESYRENFSFPSRGDVLISAAGTIGRTVVYDGEEAYFQDSNIVWLDHDESIVTNAYLRHWYKVIQWATDGSTIRRLYNSNLLRARILVPPPAEQDQIVEVLDKFDALVNDISIGLPAELNARRKQYEYYRDRLLTFKEAA
ncbi:restriction endonuclease subunit S [Micrococcus sp. EYE_162]|uniref:restriction endonuclease subunit S n=1 Tax=unclassified Micrococcus TaxID=2620948 RepID=UPI00200500DE|nr:restriction endonuclease subunit S [Micrococcus sp. EYE_212]MCK6172679.1 restriction endonuclease subunit S [Micrococcus sp. EYE_162]